MTRSTQPRRSVSELEDIAAAVRMRVLTMIMRGKFGFIGSCCSCTELIVCVGCSAAVDAFGSSRPARARLILSKGHAAPALYAALAEYGNRPHAGRYAAINSDLQGHPNARFTSEVAVSSGSLGLAVPVSVGIAIGHALLAEPTRTYVIVGDGELQTGVVWEALAYVARLPLQPRLTVMVDCNGLQSTGRVVNADRVKGMTRALTSDWLETDGNHMAGVLAAVTRSQSAPGLSVIWANTRRGAGLPGFDEDSPMSALPDADVMRRWMDSLGGSVSCS